MELRSAVTLEMAEAARVRCPEYAVVVSGRGVAMTEKPPIAHHHQSWGGHICLDRLAMTP